MYRVAIVGRPNVGKSTLFNRLTGTRRALVSKEPGMTRDRLFQTARWDGKQFEVIDTGGIVPDDKAPMSEKVLEQATVAIEEADLILFVVDGRQGIVPLDEELNALLRSTHKEYLVVVNKIDAPEMEAHALPFYAFGVERLYSLSAEHRVGVADLIEQILTRVPTKEDKSDEEEIRVAIIGRPNVGKSSLVNRLLGKERVIVTEIPGTTRDAVDTLLRFKHQNYRLIDTAGIRRKGKTEQMPEKLSVVMARKNLQRADVVLLVIDATEGATKLDATIGGYAHDSGNSVIIVVNKWDQVEKEPDTARRLEQDFRMRMRFLDYAPLLFVSARTGRNVRQILDYVAQAQLGRQIRVPTGELNQLLQKEVAPTLPVVGRTRKSPLKYACQVGISPPTFVVFIRGREKLHFSTERFLVNQIRQRYGFYATPLKIIQRPGRKDRD